MLSHSLTSEAHERGLSRLDLKFESHGQVDCIRSAGNGWDLLREEWRVGKEHLTTSGKASLFSQV